MTDPSKAAEENPLEDECWNIAQDLQHYLSLDNYGFNCIVEALRDFSVKCIAHGYAAAEHERRWRKYPEEKPDQTEKYGHYIVYPNSVGEVGEGLYYVDPDGFRKWIDCNEPDEPISISWWKPLPKRPEGEA